MLIVNLVCAVLSIFLAFVSLSILKEFQLRKIRKSLWSPILFSSVFLMVGALIGIYNAFSSYEIYEILHHINWSIGLLSLTYGTYLYYRMIKTAPKPN